MGRAYQNRKESMAKTSDAKARVYSKYGRVIYMCAKEGGIDPEGNLALRGLIERAKKDQVPTHVIEKAINKAQGGGVKISLSPVMKVMVQAVAWSSSIASPITPIAPLVMFASVLPKQNPG